MNKMTTCKTCGAEIAANAKRCPHCGAKNSQPVYKRVWFWLLIIFIVFPLIVSIAASGGGTETEPSNSTVSSFGSLEDSAAGEEGQGTASSEPSVFDGDCGISATAEMGSSIIGYPDLTISISNTSGKDISAIRFYAVPYDVYGDEIHGIFRQSSLYTDETIPAGDSTSIYYQFIEDSVKTVKLYVYSVYFADGTEWGNKDAPTSTIEEKGALIEVLGES